MEEIFVLTGKSSAGKDAIQKRLCEKYGFTGLISTTSRPIRNGEKEGVAYYFKTNEEFEEMIKNDEMIEYRTYTSANGDNWYYGLSKDAFKVESNKKVVVLELFGLTKLKEYLKDKNVYTFYVATDEEVREKRAKSRGSFDEDEWQRRLVADNNDFTIEKTSAIVDYMVYNNNRTLDEVINDMFELIKEVDK